MARLLRRGPRSNAAERQYPHLIDQVPNLGAVVEVWGGKNVRFRAGVVAIATDWDLAVLEPEPHVMDSLDPWDIGRGGYVGEDVWHVGFPAPLNVPVLRRGTIALVVAHPDEAVVVDRDMTLTDLALPTPAAFLIDMPAFHGASGGPIVDSSGLLIGIVSRGPQAPGFDVPMPMDLLIATRLYPAVVRSGLGEHFPDLVAGSEPG